MKVLSFKPGHDGSIAFVRDGQLIYSLEAEKDSARRNTVLTPSLVINAAKDADDWPDVIALSGWLGFGAYGIAPIGAGYSGLGKSRMAPSSFFGQDVHFFTSTHELAHLYSVAALSPAAPIDECVMLLWEGTIGAFYHWRDFGRSIRRIPALWEPGDRYAALYGLADPGFADEAFPRFEDAGKLMALAGFGDATKLTQAERETVERLLAKDLRLHPFEKRSFRGSPVYNCGVDTPTSHNAARHLTDRIFEIFYHTAVASCPRGLPLLITGGCGLNCEWNQRWHDSELFSDVFVPPCPNDSGAAIGTAVEAAAHFGEPCRLNWSVYSGAEFVQDVSADSSKWSHTNLDVGLLAEQLAQDQIVAWVQGRCEIGPRALGHRSLLASPLKRDNRDHLNRVKRRESFRPIAPCCALEDLTECFQDAVDDPYMLYFSKVRTERLPAITHVDGTARVQVVRNSDVPTLHRLLHAFRERSGVAVLCNTSLNYPGRGFINRASDLFQYCEANDINHVVINDSWFQLRPKRGV